MSVHKIIVTHRELARALTGKLESTLDVTNKELRKSPEFVAHVADALHLLEEAERGPGGGPDRKVAVMSTAQDQLASVMQTLLAREAAEKGAFKPEAAGSYEATFDGLDPRWVKALYNKLRRIKPHQFLKASAKPEPLDDDVRVGVIGDWGTGLYGAPMSAESMKRSDCKLLVHLGDIYYSGDEDEVRDRFLQFWPSAEGVTSRACNGNHEMYTGGNAYFKQVLPAFQQRASYFAFQNENWLLVGLDTAYEDHDLAGEQVAWLTHLVSKAGKRKTILFSHHQPFSLLERHGPKLQKKLNPLLKSGRIFAWYWGHEHRCVLYDRYPDWQMYGRCIGHGGIPYYRHPFGRLAKPDWERKIGTLVPSALVLDGPNKFVPEAPHEYGPQGYATIHLKGPVLRESIHLPDGTTIKDQELR